MRRAASYVNAGPGRLERETLPLPPDGNLRVAIVADTHSEPHPRAYELVRAQKPDAILHAGDIGSREVVAALSEIAPTHAIRGNIDEHGLPDDIVLDFQRGTLLLTHIAVYGPKLRKEVATRAHAEQATIVVCGHSHVPFLGRDKGLVVFNPGSIGPRRFILPIVFGMMVIENDRLTFSHVSCETGERWLP